MSRSFQDTPAWAGWISQREATQSPVQLGNPRKGFSAGMGYRAHQTPGRGTAPAWEVMGAKETSLGTDWCG